MSVRKRRGEIRHLQVAFEREADRFHDLSLSILYVRQTASTIRNFRQPHHIIMLWQYYGDLATSEESPIEVPAGGAVSVKIDVA